MPAQNRGLLDCQHCHRPKGSLAHTPHSSQRADSPRVYFATMALLYHRPCLMIAESGAPAPPGRYGRGTPRPSPPPALQP